MDLIKEITSRECEMEKHMKQFTLERYLKRQRVLLHGYEERKFKFIPKVNLNVTGLLFKFFYNTIKLFAIF